MKPCEVATCAAPYPGTTSLCVRLTAKLDCQSDETRRTTADLLDGCVDASYSAGRRWTLLDEFRRDS